MKNVITLLACMLGILTGFAQSDLSGSERIVPATTPQLEALYQIANQLENNGTAAEINANRLAIKNAWQQVDPAIAALYKPIETNGATLPAISEGSYEESVAPEDWDIDGFLRDGFIDALDMSVTLSGDIYITAVENHIGSAGDANMYVYRSTDNGNSFALWNSQVFNTTLFKKIKTISIDGTGDEYLLVYMLDDADLFSVLRINMATKSIATDIVSTGVTDFAVDRNYPLDTSSQRVFATYLKEEPTCIGGLLHSARSTAGSYGFDWVDETNFGTCAKHVDYAYGRNGGSYTTFVGGFSGDLYAKFNPNSNDPASWGSNEIIESGSSRESLNPSISAAKLAPSGDIVVIFSSSRIAGSTNHYDAKGYKRENGGSFAEFQSFVAGGFGTWNIMQPNSWVRNSNGTETIRFAYTRVSTGAVENNTNRSLTFNGVDFDPLEPVSDSSRDVFEGYPAAIAETKDGLPCMAFSGVSTGIRYGYGLYFDRKSDMLEIVENNLEDLTIFPNPAQDILNISSKSTVENISIHSLLGQEVMQVSPEQENPSINIASLSAGVYIMKVAVDGQIGSYKIIKE